MSRERINIFEWLEARLDELDVLPTEDEIPRLAKLWSIRLDKAIALPIGLEQADGPVFRFVIHHGLVFLVRRRAKRAQPKPGPKPSDADPTGWQGG